MILTSSTGHRSIRSSESPATKYIGRHLSPCMERDKQEKEFGGLEPKSRVLARGQRTGPCQPVNRVLSRKDTSKSCSGTSAMILRRAIIPKVLGLYLKYGHLF
jgi:hypothetical protein